MEVALALTEVSAATAEVILVSLAIAGVVSPDPAKFGSLPLAILSVGILFAYEYREVKKEKYPAPSAKIFELYKPTTVELINNFERVRSLNSANPVRARLGVYLSNLAYETRGVLSYIMATDAPEESDRKRGSRYNDDEHVDKPNRTSRKKLSVQLAKSSET